MLTGWTMVSFTKQAIQEWTSVILHMLSWSYRSKRELWASRLELGEIKIELVVKTMVCEIGQQSTD